jgi:DNA-binding protein WhiA
MEVLNVKIEKEMRNDWNRIANSENANFDKVVMAAVRQIKAIDKIEKTIGIESLPEELQEVARLRKENKDLSLDALGKKMNPPLSKSGVNHRIKKILEIAEKRL